jgi:uncharacterized membrane protein YeaQ/YmgE (transglycosylase-associated protein family)
VLLALLGGRAPRLHETHNGAHKEFTVINIVLWLVMGAVVGWVASLLMKTDGQQGTLLNIVFGIVGASVGGFGFRLLGFSGSNINEGFSVYSFVVSVIGAVVVIALAQLLRRGVTRHA